MAQIGSSGRFRATQLIQGEAQSEGNGIVLFKGCNTILDQLGCSRRASREALVRGVPPLGKDAPLPARRALRPSASQLAEIITTTYLGHRHE